MSRRPSRAARSDQKLPDVQNRVRVELDEQVAPAAEGLPGNYTLSVSATDTLGQEARAETLTTLAY